ncbi:hypothetical protein ALQ39_00548 [Pseudomonas amygdali pv. eriobotryae]|uniref:Uncharacterized protein n=1 Tax=Pseudomonas amygdali pv. eriobotryae TaxID=129137 RepID=A0A3M3X9J7_PSEA0|nr:hypothetical protein ALQ39_00548 [Pseudomonas amygdali pv. eriobotryae]
MTAAVHCQVFHSLVLKLFELLLVGAVDPAGRPHGDRLVGALDLVFFLQTAGDHIELQHTDGAEDDVVAALREEHLRGAFFGQLLKALTQLLGFERVLQAHAAEQLRCEVRNTGEAQCFAFGEGVADLDGAVVVQTDDVTGIGFFQLLTLRREERQRITDPHVLAQAHVAHFHSLVVTARTDTHERDTVAVLGVHVRLDLEHETAEFLFGRFDGALVGHACQWLGSPVHHGIEYMVDAEVAQRGAEKQRGQLAVDEFLLVELVAGTLHQFQLLDKAVVLVTQMGAGFVRIELLDDFGFRTLVAMTCCVHNDVVVGQVIDTLEVPVATNRPGDRRSLDLEYGFDFIKQLDRVADVAVELVDETDDRRVAQAADIHQRNGAWLDAFTAVEDHQRRVNGCQGAVGVFGEVFVTRCVEQVDHVLAIRKLHHGCGDGNTALFLHFHPVGCGMTVGFTRLDRTGDRNGLAHQQEFFRDGGFTRIRVGNNGESAAFRDFGGLLGHGKSPETVLKKGADYSSTRGNNRTVQTINDGQIMSRVGTFQVVETSTPPSRLATKPTQGADSSACWLDEAALMACVFAEVKPLPATHPLLFANVIAGVLCGRPGQRVRRLK